MASQVAVAINEWKAYSRIDVLVKMLFRENFHESGSRGGAFPHKKCSNSEKVDFRILGFH